MATMNLNRTVFFNLWRAFPRSRAQQPLTSSRKVSRLCFASAGSQSQGRDPVENARDSRADLAHGSKKWREEATGKAIDDTSSDDTSDDEVGGTVRKGKEKASEYARAAKDRAYDAKERTKEKASETKDKANEYAEHAKGKASEGVNKDDTKERAKEYAEETRDKAKEMAHEAKERAEEYGNDVKEKAKGTVKGAWEATRNTARKMTEAVVGPDEAEDRADHVEDHTKKAPKGPKDREEDKFKKY